jgi:hypothetical protein
VLNIENTLLARSCRVEVTGPRGADGSLRANRFGSVATNHNGFRTADGAYLIDIPNPKFAINNLQFAAEHVAVGLEHLVLDWFNADVAPGGARRRLGRRERLVELGLCRIVALYYRLILFITESLTYLVPIFLNDNVTQP